MAAEQRFFEVIKPGVDVDFVGKQKWWIGSSIVLVVATFAMLLLNAFVLKDRGRALNWGVDFRGGTEIVTSFPKQVDPGVLRDAMAAGGFHGAEVVKYGEGTGATGNAYMIRLGAVSVVSGEQSERARALLATVGDAKLRQWDFSEGGDKVYARFDRALEPAALKAALAEKAGINATQVQPFGKIEDHTFEITLIGMDSVVQKAIEGKLGPGSVKIDQVSSVGAKAGKQLQLDGLKALVGAILLIVIYVAFRFDFRYGPGTIVALLHDAVITVGAFAATYKEFSLTTLAALLTIIGFSMNDTIVVFDRIRENAAKYRDRRFDRVVNQSINETLSRTILTSATVFFVTLAMNVFGTGVIEDFAFAMNVGVVVGTYSSIFIASPILIWLNDKFLRSQKRLAARGPQGRRPQRDEDQEPIEPTDTET